MENKDADGVCRVNHFLVQARARRMKEIFDSLYPVKGELAKVHSSEPKFTAVAGSV
jgi:hypothetical protein